MSEPDLVIRPAQDDDGAAIAAVYAPYVLDTPVSFEVEPPSARSYVRTWVTTV